MRLRNLGLKIRQTALQQLPDFCGPVPKAAVPFLVFTGFPSLTILTEILRFAQNDCRAGRLAHNAVFILIDAKGVDTTTLSGKGRC